MQAAHEAVLGERLRFDTFKRRMKEAGMRPDGPPRAAGRGRPWVVYTRDLPDALPERDRLPRSTD